VPKIMKISLNLLKLHQKYRRLFFPDTMYNGLLGGVMVRASDLRSSGRGFDSRPGLYRATYRSTQPSIPPG